MPYEAFARLVETHKETLAAQMADAVEARQLISPYDTREEFIPRLSESIESVLYYLRTGDISQWRDNVVAINQNRQERSIPVENFHTINEIAFDIIKALVDRELPGPEHERTRASYHRRLDGIKMVSNVTAINYRVKRGG